MEECGKKIITCEYCNEMILNKDKIYHNSICEFVLEECIECQTQIKRKNLSAHDKIEYLINQVNFWNKFEDSLNKNLILEEKLQASEKENQNLRSFLNNSRETGLSSNNVQYQSFYKTKEITSLKYVSGFVYTICYLSAYESGLICCGNLASILLFRFPALEKVESLKGHSNYIWSIVHLSQYDINYIASGGQDKTIKIWNISTGDCLKTLTGHEDWVTTVSPFHLHSNILLSSSSDHTVRIWDLDTGSQLQIITNVYGKVCGNAFSFNSSYIIYGSRENKLVIYDYSSNNIKGNLIGHNNLIDCFSNLGEFNKNYIVTGSKDKNIIIWDISKICLVKILSGHTQRVNFVSHLIGFSGGNTIIASGSDDTTIRLWSLLNFQCVSVLNIHNSSCKSFLNLKGEFTDYFLTHDGKSGVIKCSKLGKYDE